MIYKFNKFNKFNENNISSDVNDIMEALYDRWDFDRHADNWSDDDYIDFVDEVMDCSKADYEDALNRLEKMINNVDYYANEGILYLQLNDDRMTNKLDIPDDVDDDYLSDTISIYVKDASDTFYQETGVKIHLFGRSDRHVCIENTFENLLKYNELREKALRMEKNVIENVDDDLKQYTK